MTSINFVSRFASQGNFPISYIAHHSKFIFCLSNTVHSSIGQNVKSLAVSNIRSPMSVLRPECDKTSNGHNSATRHPIYFVFGSRLGVFSKDSFI